MMKPQHLPVSEPHPGPRPRRALAPVRALSLLLAMLASLAASPLRAADLSAFNGEWIYVEDRTEGRSLEEMGPPMSSKFSLGTEDGAVILTSGHGSGNKNVRVALDGSVTEVAGKSTARYRAEWKDGVLAYEMDFVREPGKDPEGLVRREFRITPDGLVVSSTLPASIALYRHPEDIAMPAPAAATIGDIAWLAGAWVGTRGTGGATSIEERWGPPLGGAMLAVSRTVSRGKLSAFEYLRIVERDGGLVYIAQPGGGPPTEFVMTEFTANRAVFDNPRHDYPKRIVYELSAEGSALTATIGFTKGGTPRRFEFKREGEGAK